MSMMKSILALIDIATVSQQMMADVKGETQPVPEYKPRPATTNKHGQHKFIVDGIEVYAMNLKNAKRKAQNIKNKCQ